MNACPCIHTAETKTVFGFSYSWFGEGLTTYNLAVILLVILALFVISKRNVRKHLINHLMAYAIIVFGVGVLLYMSGFNYEGTCGNFIPLFLRSVMASMEMFVSESELIEVQEACKEDVIYMLLFAVTHFLAICVSAAFIIHLLGIRLKSYVYMRWPWSRKKELFVFFDLSQFILSKGYISGKKGERLSNCFRKDTYGRKPLRAFLFLSYTQLCRQPERNNRAIDGNRCFPNL